MAESPFHIPQALFFDLDGTLLDSLPGIAFSIEQAFAACSMPMRPLDLREVIGPPIREILALASIHATDSELDLLERAFRNSYDSEGWQKTLLFPGSTAMLHEASVLGIRLFVVSNKPRHIAIKILEREGLFSLFTAMITRDSSDPPFRGKAKMIEHLLGVFQLDAAHCIMIGDTAEDAIAASEMLVPFAWMTHGYGKISPSLDVALRINSFPELIPTLVKEFAQ
jgi:phosphoglycolate phosphatase